MRRAAALTALTAGTLTLGLLAGCSSLTAGAGSDGDSSEPVPAHTQLPTIDPAEVADHEDQGGPVDTARTVDPARIVDPGWDTAAQEADGIFLSLHAKKSGLEFRAVDSTGELLWTAERPRVCSGFLVSDTADSPVAVLMDEQSGASDSLAPTASGYDLATGKKLWGPVEVPGALLGSGLVFAGGPKDFIGKSGPRVALNPATGQRLATEDPDEAENPKSQKVIAALGRHLVLSDGDRLIGRDLDGRRLWARDVEDLGVSVAEARDLPWEYLGDSQALMGSASGGDRRLIDLDSGDEAARDSDGASLDAADFNEAGFDAQSQTLVTATTEGTLQGFGPDGDRNWERELPAGAELTAVGSGLIVIESFSDDNAAPEPEGTATSADGSPSEEGNSTLVLSAKDGKRVPADGQAADIVRSGLGAPHHIAGSGAALIGDPGSPLLMITAEQ